MVLSRVSTQSEILSGMADANQYRKGARSAFTIYIFRKSAAHSRSYWKRCFVIEIAYKRAFLFYCIASLFPGMVHDKPLNLLILMAAVAMHITSCM